MLNLTATRDRTQEYLLTLTQDGNPLDLTGLDIVFTVKKTYASINPIFQISTITGGIIVTDAPNGKATMTIAATDTKTIPTGTSGDDIKLLCDFALLSGVDPEPLDRGTITIQLNVGDF